MRILYLDCFSGISGDMAVAALVDAGADREYIEAELDRIKIEPYKLEWRRVVKCGVSSLKFDVVLDPEHPPQHHRHYSEIVALIKQAGLNDKVTAMSLDMFEKIAKAEAKIHQTTLDHVHFHEVGAIDSIVDIIAVALAVDSLNADRIFSSPVPLGSGTVRCDHGLYPVPAPATLEMMKGIPIAPTKVDKEMTTPTGAAIAAVLSHDFLKGLPPMTVEAIGYGAGTRDLPDQPNVLRVVVGQAESRHSAGSAWHSHSHGHHHDHSHSHGHSHEHDHGHHDHHHDHSRDHDH